MKLATHGMGHAHHEHPGPCPVAGCGRRIRGCNLVRHMKAAHPDAPETAAAIREAEKRPLLDLLRRA